MMPPTEFWHAIVTAEGLRPSSWQSPLTSDVNTPTSHRVARAGASLRRSRAAMNPTSATGDAGDRNSIIFLVTYGGLEEPVHIELQRGMQKRL